MPVFWPRATALAVALLLAALVASAPAQAPRGELRVDGRAALSHVERLVALGPRPAGSPAAEKARAYIIDELRRAGVVAEVRPFEADTPHGRLRMANIVARLPGRRADVIMLAGHYDTKLFKSFRFVGANDGGSSAALLIELARRLARAPREYTLWIVWFDGEESREAWTATDSLYGSRHLATTLAREGRLPRAMVLVDMIGDRALNIRRESASTPWLTDILWASAARLGHGRNFLNDAMPVEDDHVPFLRAGVPAALLIDFDFPPWHTAEDTLDKVSAQSLAIVGDVVLDALPSIEHYLTRAGSARR
ncbi:MAG TPA: M28 family peptidase [Methylomirabilota bacterium]|nr:M28 family peptidase [Methylomirabilota bacterium]